MIEKARILIVEDEAMIAMDIVDHVEAIGGIVVGPVPTVAQALAMIGRLAVDGAILDGNLADRDVTPLAIELVSRAVPIVVYSGKGLPAALALQLPDVPLVLKPAKVTEAIDRLSDLLTKRKQSRDAG